MEQKLDTILKELELVKKELEAVKKDNELSKKDFEEIKVQQVGVIDSCKQLDENVKKTINLISVKQQVTKKAINKKEFFPLFISDPQSWSTVVDIQRYLVEGKATEETALQCWKDNLKSEAFKKMINTRLNGGK